MDGRIKPEGGRETCKNQKHPVADISHHPLVCCSPLRHLDQTGNRDRPLNMAYRRGRKSIREAYEEHFSHMNTREVRVHRVVNVGERRSPMPRPWPDYDRDVHDDQWYGGSRKYQDSREYHGEGSYPPSDSRYFDENPNFGGFRRNSSPPRNQGSYSQQCHNRDDSRHRLGPRNNGRPGPHYSHRGRGLGHPQRPLLDRKAKDHNDYRISPPVVITRDRSPGRKEAQPPVPRRSGSNTSNRSFSPDRDKGHINQQAQQRHKPGVLTGHTPSNPGKGSPQRSGSAKEKTPASVAESEEAVAASMEPKPTPGADLKTRRLEAIKAKALEIEKHYRQDCETFRTVVKMLVDKEPSLVSLLQAPLDENLLEIKQRCLDALRHFVKELDKVLQQPDDTSAQATGHKTLE